MYHAIDRYITISVDAKHCSSWTTARTFSIIEDIRDLFLLRSDLRLSKRLSQYYSHRIFSSFL